MVKVIHAQQVAEYFIWKASQEGKPVTNKKLQKLLYYAQAWSIVLRNQKIFKEKIEAWVHGPAIRSIYLEFKKFGFSPIEKNIEEAELKKIPLEVIKILDQVWKVYGKLDADYLELLTHSEEPWQQARNGLQDYANSENEITTASMKDFYTKKLQLAQVK